MKQCQYERKEKNIYNNISKQSIPRVKIKAYLNDARAIGTGGGVGWGGDGAGDITTAPSRPAPKSFLHA